MKCPKCHFEQIEENSECDKCGLIFEKYFSMLGPHSEDSKGGTERPTIEDTESPISIGHVFFYTKPEDTIAYFIGRSIVFIVLIFWGFKFITAPIESNYAGGSFMHLINLPFHEAGHVFFRPFGSFMASLGGTIGQFMMPFICFLVLLIKTRDTFGASVTLWWLGQNFFDIAPYVNDARSLSLPLLGGNYGHSSPYGFHDWEFILTESGLLKYDHFIAKLCLTLGTTLFIVSTTWGAILLFKQYKSRT